MGDLETYLRGRARAAGFDHTGFATARPAPLAAMLRVWLERNMHGSMRYMEDPERRRADPGVYLPWARSLVVTLLGYKTPFEVPTAPEHGAISRYAWGLDYHREVRARLQILRRDLESAAPGCRTHLFVDTSPILEKGVAVAAGLGWRGKHTNLLRKRAGSWFFIGGIATDLDLAPDAPVADHCGSCSRCIDVCPTGAIVAPYVLDARLCIAYLTIELRGPIPRQLRPRLGNRVFGCDDCQDVCPWNRFAQNTEIPAFLPRGDSLNPLLVELIALTRSEWNRRFKKTPVRRAHYEGFLRNVTVALGNWGAPEAAPALIARLDDASSLVRGHVAWALGRVRTPVAWEALQSRAPLEPDAWVQEEISAALSDTTGT